MNQDLVLRAFSQVAGTAGSAETLAENEFFRGLYPVPNQARAFDFDKILIIGGRGTGKTQVFRALLHPEGRAAVVKATGVRLGHDPNKMISIEGFASGRSFLQGAPPHPAADVIDETIPEENTKEARLFWLAVSLARLAINTEALNLFTRDLQNELQRPGQAISSPRELLRWVHEDIEHPFALLDKIDTELNAAEKTCVFTFDALDRAANDWDRQELAVAGLLSLALDVSRRNRAIRLKVFLRPDLETAGARSFPDASKLRGHREVLSWESADLYRLAFKRLVAQAEGGEEALRLLRKEAGNDAFTEISPLGWTPTEQMDVAAQERIMSFLVGRYMGANPRKGRTYQWIPNHLADAKRVVSPRSFLVALQKATQWTLGRPRSVEPPLSPSALVEGVKAASLQRVEELQEDFPWMEEVARRLEKLLVPSPRDKVLERLATCKFASVQRRGLRSDDPEETLSQLVDLGVFLEEPGLRYNVPDLYRVAMAMTRKGGIKVAE